MVIQPQTRAAARQSVIDRLTSEVSELDNFAEGTPEWVIADAFAAEWREYQHHALAAQLSGWIEYAGGPVTEGDLRDVGVDPEVVDLALLNSQMDDRDLDAEAATNGVERIPGSKAQGTVAFGTAEGRVVIDAGTTVVTNNVEINGTYRQLEFVTTETVTSPQGQTTVSARAQANRTGPEYNVAAGTITRVPGNPGGIRGVTNTEPMSGGEGPETNDELRERAQNAPTDTSGGGTVAGIEGALVEGIEGIEADNVNTIEHHAPPDSDPGPYNGNSYAEFVVDGGSDTEVRDILDTATSCGIGYKLTRPTRTTIDVTATVAARHDTGDIDTEQIGDVLTAHLSDLGIGEDVFRLRMADLIFDTSEEIANVPSLTITADGADVSGDYVVAPDEVARAGSMDFTVVQS